MLNVRPKVTGKLKVMDIWGISVESEILSCESDPADNETNEDEDNNSNESSKGASNADAFCVRDSYGVVRTNRVLSYSTIAAQENQRSCSEKTKVYNGTAKNK
ncbi:hypothetical protein TNCV_1640361 [Trichonephila clavipes]|nr:hypothetical protein TNCV_1640361 [Trichonephila clavipes]